MRKAVATNDAPAVEANSTTISPCAPLARLVRLAAGTRPRALAVRRARGLLVRLEDGLVDQELLERDRFLAGVVSGLALLSHRGRPPGLRHGAAWSGDGGASRA